MKERRKSRRFKAGKYLQAVPNESDFSFFKLKDINSKGMSIIYIKNSKPLPDTMVIDLFYWGETPLAVKNIKCETVYDIPDLTSNISYRGLNTFRRGLSFACLTAGQARKLERILTKITGESDPED